MRALSFFKLQLSSDLVHFCEEDKDARSSAGGGINWAERFPYLKALTVTYRGIITPEVVEKLLAELSPLKLRRLVRTQDCSLGRLSLATLLSMDEDICLLRSQCLRSAF